jgi:hypothetical protein
VVNQAQGIPKERMVNICLDTTSKWKIQIQTQKEDKK